MVLLQQVAVAVMLVRLARQVVVEAAAVLAQEMVLVQQGQAQQDKETTAAMELQAVLTVFVLAVAVAVLAQLVLTQVAATAEKVVLVLTPILIGLLQPHLVIVDIMLAVAVEHLLLQAQTQMP
jgi:hypothetical protein